jgi:uncharacterized protein (TIGR00661 family)
MFIVQGEGRGHMTQALALGAMLRRAGHRVAQVLVGRSARRTVPDFFLEKVDAPVRYFESPNFVCDGGDRAIRLGSTLWHAVRRSPHLRHSLREIDAAMADARPDVVINFFEPLAGLYYALRRPDPPMVCIAHQYLCLHPRYTFPDVPDFPHVQAVQRRALRAFARITSWGARRRLALSLTPMADVPSHRTRVVPPLLRDELFRQEPRPGDFLLVYLLNRGYAAAIRRWHAQHPDVPLHCFWDHPEAEPVERVDDTLTFHRLHDEKFLRLMAGCRGLVTTAGFESVCEAMYLGKPALMVPVEGHFEQHCNALDAAAAGAGIASADFAIDRLIAHADGHRSTAPAFRAWVDRAEDRFLTEIEAVASAAPRLRPDDAVPA